MQDGKSILTGWNDGKIRAFTPQTGKLLFTINDAHHKAVTAIAATADSSRIVSGGEEGEWPAGRLVLDNSVVCQLFGPLLTTCESVASLSSILCCVATPVSGFWPLPVCCHPTLCVPISPPAR